MAIFPMEKRAAVADAPNQTSRHAISTSGSILNMAANRSVVKTKEKPKSTRGQRDVVNGSRPSKYLLMAARAVVAASETITRMQIATTMKNDNNRVRRMSSHIWRGLGVTSQIVFIAS